MNNKMFNKYSMQWLLKTNLTNTNKCDILYMEE